MIDNASKAPGMGVSWLASADITKPKKRASKALSI